MEEIKKIGVLSAAKMSALFGVLLGLISGAALWAWFAYLAKLPTEVLTQAGFTEVPSYGFGQFLMNVAQGTLTTVLAIVILVLIYNLFAKWVGGVCVELKEKKAVSKKRQGTPIKGKKK